MNNLLSTLHSKTTSIKRNKKMAQAMKVVYYTTSIVQTHATHTLRYSFQIASIDVNIVRYTQY